MTDADITISRTFDAPREPVFAAWTDPAQFARWFGTAATTVDQVSMELRPGGAWAAHMVLGDGGEIAWHGSYLEVEPPSRLVLTLSDNPGEAFDTCAVVLTEVAGGTEMTFTQSGGHMPPEGYAQAEAGWQAFFDDLAVLLPAA